MSKFLKTVKNALLLYWDGAKHFVVDAGLLLIAIGALIYWYYTPGFDTAGGVAILAVYASRNLIYHNSQRKIIKELISKLGKK